MRRLLLLISVPPPHLRGFLPVPALLVTIYLVLRTLRDAGLLDASPLVLAVPVALTLSWGLSLGNLLRRIDGDRTALVMAAIMVFATWTPLVLLDDPRIMQRAVSAGWIINAALLAHAIRFSPDSIPRLGGPKPDGTWFPEAWARWKIIALGFLFLGNEAAIGHGSEEEWLVYFCVAPVVAHCLKWWTLAAFYMAEE